MCAKAKGRERCGNVWARQDRSTNGWGQWRRWWRPIPSSNGRWQNCHRRVESRQAQRVWDEFHDWYVKRDSRRPCNLIQYWGRWKLGTGEVWNGKLEHNKSVPNYAVVFEAPKPSFQVSLSALLACTRALKALGMHHCAQQPATTNNHPSNHSEAARNNSNQPKAHSI